MNIEIPLVKGSTYTVEIVSMGHSAEGVGKYEGFTVFVPFALPGEEVEVIITEVKKNYAKGKLRKVLKKSTSRVTPACEIYEACGGCQMQHLQYDAQLEVKRRQVVDAVRRIGKQENVLVHPTIGAEYPWNYRNKMQFPVGKDGNDVIVGCYAQGTHNIVSAENCLIQHASNNTIANAVRGILRRLNISVYDEKTRRGVIRHIIGRVGAASGEVMVVLVTSTETLPKREKIIEELRGNIPGLVSIMQNINEQNTNVVLGKRMLKLWGKPAIADTMGEFTFDISARSFYQVNTAQAEKLYQKAVEYAGLTGKETVIDTYCGTGTITLFLAKRAKKVYGVEVIESAIRDANRNAERNQAANVEFIAGDATDILPKLQEQGVRPDVIVVDPPRAGCEKSVLETFAKLHPARIVYVSCNPASLARDIAILASLGYTPKEIQPVDLFSQTSHVESVCLLTK